MGHYYLSKFYIDPMLYKLNRIVNSEEELKLLEVVFKISALELNELSMLLAVLMYSSPDVVCAKSLASAACRRKFPVW